MGRHEHDPRLYPGCERFFRPLDNGSLVQSWIPALDGVADKLAAGARVADVGCGHGVGAASHVRDALTPDGTWLLVEPMAGDRTEADLNPVGRLYYAGSVMLCTPSALTQEVGLGLGNQIGEKRLADLLTEAGFGHVHRATETPFNLILEVRP